MTDSNTNESFKGDEWTLYDAPYTRPFEFEKFDVMEARVTMQKNAHISILASVMYVILIFVGKRWMKNKAPYNLRVIMTIWNFSLAFFSIFGFLRIYKEFFSVLLSPNGLFRSLCIRDEHNISSAFWARAFVYSKLFELIDTAFIILRKQKLIFLHCYHHISVVVLTWHFYADYEPIFRWYGIMNYLIHFFMYSYYALRSMKLKLPRGISMFITILQLSQFIIGLCLNVYSFKLIMYDKMNCARRKETFPLHFIMYASYLVLFINYFWKTYLFSKTKSEKTQ